MRAARASRLLAALLVLASMGAAAAVDLGTLFTTPDERARLDRLRRGEAVAQPGVEAPARRREVTGYVKRSDGRATAFIDGVPVPVDPQGAPLLEPDNVRPYAPRPSEDLKVERKDAR